jgi:hypothetical protein
MPQRGKMITFRAVGALGLGFILEVVFVGTNAWAEADSGPGSIGLFQVCGLLVSADIDNKTGKIAFCKHES